MGNLRAFLAVAMIAACGSDHGQQVDAGIVIIDSAADAKEFFDAPPPTFDFSCTGNPAPTMAAAQITLSGTVRRVDFTTSISITTLDGASLKACAAAATNCTGPDQFGTTATSAGGGNFSIGPFNTSSAPVDAFIEMTHTGSRTISLYPASPFVADQAMLPVLTFTPGAMTALGFAGCNQDVTKGMIALAVTDCSTMPITDTANLNIVLKQGGSVITGYDKLDLGALQAQAAGVFLLCNVPVNATTNVGANYKGMDLRAHDVKVVAGTTTATQLRPGF